MRISTHIAALLLVGILVEAEIIDQIAVTVGNAVITQSDVIRQVRLTAFFNGEPVTMNEETKRAAAQRLVDQQLVRSELEASRYAPATPEEAEKMLSELIRDRFGGSRDAFLKEARRYSLSEEGVQEQMRWQLTMIRFIDVRFGIGNQATEQEVDQYFSTKVLPQLPEGSPPVPTEEQRAKIEEILAQQKATEAATDWLAETQRRTVIDYHPEAFR